MGLYILMAIALLQWLLLSTFTTFDPTGLLYGNLQVLIPIWVFKTAIKYIKF